jgi:paraquat-inducible protein B
MAKRANPTLIGAFVLGGLTLVVATVLLLGGREWFKRPVTCVMAFDGNVTGLAVGSPVSIRGVQVGTVSSIQIRAGTPFVIVTSQFDPARVSGLPGLIAEKGLAQTLQDAVERGMRARLETLSLVTGQLYIGLEEHPETPARMTGIDKAHCEIPTIPSALAQFQDQAKKILATMEQLPLKELVASATRAIEGVDQMVRAPELRRTVESLDSTLLEARAVLRNIDTRVDTSAAALQTTLAQAQRTVDEVGRDVSNLVRNVDNQVQPLAANLTSTSDSARELMGDVQRSLHNVDEQLGPALASFRAASDSARDALRKAERSFDQVNGVLDGRSPLGSQLVDALDELTRAVRIWRSLGEEIDRQPNMLFLGRGASKE